MNDFSYLNSEKHCIPEVEKINISESQVHMLQLVCDTCSQGRRKQFWFGLVN